MGASSFMDWSKGKDNKEAFNRAVDEAAWENGHGGYTGTIAEKRNFVIISLPKEIKPDDYNAIEEFAWKLIEDSDSRINDKWGPAGCIKASDRYLFFGNASS